MTTIKQLLAPAKSYQLKFSGKIYNDFRLKHNRIKFYFVNQNADSTPGLCFEFKTNTQPRRLSLRTIALHTGR